jgi:hypothetical protein
VRLETIEVTDYHGVALLFRSARATALENLRATVEKRVLVLSAAFFDAAAL